MSLMPFIFLYLAEFLFLAWLMGCGMSKPVFGSMKPHLTLLQKFFGMGTLGLRGHLMDLAEWPVCLQTRHVTLQSQIPMMWWDLEGQWKLCGVPSWDPPQTKHSSATEEQYLVM